MEGEKQLDVPIVDYDTDDYSEVIEVVVEEEKLETKLLSNKPHDLLVYFTKRFKQEHGYDYTVDWVKETVILKAYVQRYGPDSGPMIELLFDRHRGLWNGQRVSVTAFAKGSKWIQDQLRSELQDKRDKENKPKTDTKGLLSSNDFLDNLSMD